MLVGATRASETDLGTDRYDGLVGVCGLDESLGGDTGMEDADAQIRNYHYQDYRFELLLLN